MSKVTIEVVVPMAASPKDFPSGLTPEHHELGPAKYLERRLEPLKGTPWQDAPKMLWCPFGRTPFGKAINDPDEDGTGNRTLIAFLPDYYNPGGAEWADAVCDQMGAMVDAHNITSIYLGDWATSSPENVLLTFLAFSKMGIKNIIIDHSAGDTIHQDIERQFTTLGGNLIREGRPRDLLGELVSEHLMLAKEGKPKWGAAVRYTPPEVTNTFGMSTPKAIGVGLWECRTSPYARSWRAKLDAMPHKSCRLFIGVGALAKFTQEDLF